MKRFLFVVLAFGLSGCGASWDYVLDSGIKVQDYLGSETSKASLGLVTTALRLYFPQHEKIWRNLDIVVVEDINNCLSNRADCMRDYAKEGVKIGPNTLVLPGDSPDWLDVLIQEVAKRVEKADSK